MRPAEKARKESPGRPAARSARPSSPLAAKKTTRTSTGTGITDRLDRLAKPKASGSSVSASGGLPRAKASSNSNAAIPLRNSSAENARTASGRPSSAKAKARPPWALPSDAADQTRKAKPAAKGAPAGFSESEDDPASRASHEIRQFYAEGGDDADEEAETLAHLLNIRRKQREEDQADDQARQLASDASVKRQQEERQVAREERDHDEREAIMQQLAAQRAPSSQPRSPPLLSPDTTGEGVRRVLEQVRTSVEAQLRASAASLDLDSDSSLLVTPPVAEAVSPCGSGRVTPGAPQVGPRSSVRRSVTASVTASMLAQSLSRPAPEPKPMSESAEFAAFEEFTREVAARVIQYYFRLKHKPLVRASTDSEYSAHTVQTNTSTDSTRLRHSVDISPLDFQGKGGMDSDGRLPKASEGDAVPSQKAAGEGAGEGAQSREAAQVEGAPRTDADPQRKAVVGNSLEFGGEESVSDLEGLLNRYRKSGAGGSADRRTMKPPVARKVKFTDEDTDEDSGCPPPCPRQPLASAPAPAPAPSASPAPRHAAPVPTDAPVLEPVVAAPHNSPVPAPSSALPPLPPKAPAGGAGEESANRESSAAPAAGASFETLKGEEPQEEEEPLASGGLESTPRRKKENSDSVRMGSIVGRLDTRADHCGSGVSAWQTEGDEAEPPRAAVPRAGLQKKEELAARAASSCQGAREQAPRAAGEREAAPVAVSDEELRRLREQHQEEQACLEESSDVESEEGVFRFSGGPAALLSAAQACDLPPQPRTQAGPQPPLSPDSDLGARPAGGPGDARRSEGGLGLGPERAGRRAPAAEVAPQLSGAPTKLRNILDYLDAVESQALHDDESSQACLTDRTIDSSYWPSAASEAGPRSQPPPACNPLPDSLLAQQPRGPAGAKASEGGRQGPAGGGSVVVPPLAVGGDAGMPSVSGSFVAPPPPPSVSSVASSSAYSGLPGSDKSSALATSVYDNVKAKMKDLRRQLKEKEDRVTELEGAVEAAGDREADIWEQAAAAQAAALEEQRVENESTVTRHLAFIDRLLADKDALTQKCAKLAAEIPATEERHEANKAELQKQWGSEMKRQKEAWEAAEKIRREAWMADKTREVKELTIRGLEPEIQRLVQKHKAEARRLEQAQAEALRRQHDELRDQHEAHSRQLRDRLLKEREDAVEKERLSGQARLREQAERYESQAQSQRMRLGTDAELALERVEAQRREEKARLEEALERARKSEAQREEQARGELQRELDDLKRRHSADLAALREKFEIENHAWKAHVQDKARKELEEREAALQKRCAAERDGQLEHVVARLEAEAAAQRLELREGLEHEAAQAAQAHAAALQRAQAHEERLQAQARQATEAEREMSGRLAAAEKHLAHVQAELAAKNESIQWLEKTVTQAKQESSVHEQDIRKVFTEKEALHREQVRAMEGAQAALQDRLSAAVADLDQMRARKEAEMDQVESRVRTAVAKKDETINGQREQIAALMQQLRHTEQVLHRQQEDFLRSSDG